MYLKIKETKIALKCDALRLVRLESCDCKPALLIIAALTTLAHSNATPTAWLESQHSNQTFTDLQGVTERSCRTLNGEVLYFLYHAWNSIFWNGKMAFWMNMKQEFWKKAKQSQNVGKSTFRRILVDDLNELENDCCSKPCVFRIDYESLKQLEEDTLISDSCLYKLYY